MMAALDLLGRRWTLRVIWELQQQPAGFRELRRRCDGISRAC
ncbi:winged helix-turn-helix transcriptional regulator [Amycolatopsis sp.]|nr:winged helix-turn-helix transcriptional regulator [Amycolatopsis sp.]